MKRCYVPRNFSAPSLQMIQQANEIIAAYTAQGYDRRMTAAALLVLTNELDQAIQEQDRLILRATVQHSRFLEPAVEVRNGLVKQWATPWQTRRVVE